MSTQPPSPPTDCIGLLRADEIVYAETLLRIAKEQHEAYQKTRDALVRDARIPHDNRNDVRVALEAMLRVYTAGGISNSGHRSCTITSIRALYNALRNHL